jgi:hypothetical protein
MKASDYKPGDRVRYMPLHANTDPNHPDCDLGIVKRSNEKYVFVLYGHSKTAKATAPEYLQHIGK